MKKLFKILLVTLVAAISALCLFACTTEAPELPGNINVDTGTYKPPVSHAYGAAPDLDNVIIDGFLDDELWTADNMKWYTHYDATSRISYKMSATVSDGGLYVAFRSDDPIVAWNGYNLFYRNTNAQFFLYSGDYGGKDVTIQLDANNVAPSLSFVNARSQYYGELNFAGKGDGISCEFYVTWADIGIKTENGAPEKMAILPIYNYCAKPTASNTNQLLPTFVKTTGNRSQAIEFDKNGYVDGDQRGAVVGSHSSGMGKTNGWTVDRVGTGEERAKSSAMATLGFPQVIYFRDVMSSRFKATTTVTFGSGTLDSRAGIIMYRDAINYRAVALQYDGRNFVSGQKFSNYVINGYTNYPSNITTTKNIYSGESDGGYTQATLTVYNNMGKLYYVLNDEFVGSEMAPYVATNNYIGLYAFDTNATFSEYECTAFESEQALLSDFSQYAYTVDVYNANVTSLNATTDQLAVSKVNGKVTVTLDFTAGYTLDDISYTVGGSMEKLSAMEYAEKAESGRFEMPVNDNVIIHTKAKKMDDGELVEVRVNAVDAETDVKVNGVTAILIGNGKFTRYAVNIQANGSVVKLPKGYSWKYEATCTGYRDSSGELFGGATVTEPVTEGNNVYVRPLTIGGTALPPADENGNNIIEFTKASSPGQVFDVSKGEEGLIVFQTSQTDKGEVYFSGRSISDYQVAYVEIVNRTDPSAFTSLENDPAAGFLIASEKGTSYVGARMNGLRFLPYKNVWSSRVDISNVLGWNGHLANTDRANGGRFINAYEGIGSTNRIPYEGKEYTTCLMLIRKGGYTYIYAADGKQGVKPDKTNFGKMKLVYSFYNEVTDGYAAIGFGTTVNYNLRMDFENYWLLCGENAAEFADPIIRAEFEVSGKNDAVDISGSGLISYDGEKGGCVKGSNITIKANQPSDNKMIKVTASSGEVYYLYDKGDSVVHTHHGSNALLELTVEEVEYETVSGKVLAPEGTKVTAYNGFMYSLSGAKIMSVKTKLNGTFSYKIEKGSKVKLAFSLNGYAMSPTEVGSEPVTLEFTEIPLTEKVLLQSGAMANSYDVTYGYNEEDGAYFEVAEVTPSEGYIFLKPENTYENMVLDMTYERLSKPLGTSGTIDSDISFGAMFYGVSGSYSMRFIGDGYRVIKDDRYNVATNLTDRGFGTPSMQAVVTGTPYDLRYVKMGSVVYMCIKLATEDEYSAIYAFDLMPYVGSVYTNVSLTWMSVGWTGIRISNIETTEIRDETLAELLGTANASTVTLSGATANATVGGIGVISANDGVYKTVKAGPVTVKATGLNETQMLKVAYGGEEYMLSGNASVEFLAPKSGNASVELSIVEGFMKSGSATFTEGMSVGKVKGTIREANGNVYQSFTTDSNGRFNVFVDEENKYYVHLYTDGFITSPVIISSDVSLDGIPFKKIGLLSSITRKDGEIDAAPPYEVPVYETVDGSLSLDVKCDNAYIDGMFIRPELANEDVLISFTYERKGKPASVSATEDGDASMGLLFVGPEGSYGMRFIAKGCRIMINDSFNEQTNEGSREGGPVDMQLTTTPEPYNFKFIKKGSVVYMCAKLQSQSEYVLVYTHNLINEKHSVGAVVTDIAISWCSWGWTDIRISDIEIGQVTEATAPEIM